MNRTPRAAAARLHGTVVTDLVDALRRTRAVDLTYTVAAQAFVGLIPLVLVLTSAFTGDGDQAVVARELVDRFGLVGAARIAVQQLFTTPGSGSGVYWLGLFVTLLSAVSLSRRMSRAYTLIWDVPPLPVSQWWRGLVWLAIQVTMTIVASGMRDVARDHGGTVALVVVCAVLALWAVAEYAAQLLLTAARVARRRLVVSVGLVTAGRVGVVLWSAVYLPRALSRQSELYGPIGVVFALFTWILATVAVLLLGPLVAAVATARPVRWWLRPGQGHPDGHG